MARAQEVVLITRVSPPTSEPVPPTKRRPVTEARKKRIHAFHKGFCGECGDETPISGPGVVYDHRIPVWTGGADDDGPNMRPVCKACDRLKTAADQGDIAKIKRIIARLDGTRRKRRAIRSKPFGKQKRAWPTRRL